MPDSYEGAVNRTEPESRLAAELSMPDNDGTVNRTELGGRLAAEFRTHDNDKEYIYMSVCVCLTGTERGAGVSGSAGEAARGS